MLQLHITCIISAGHEHDVFACLEHLAQALPTNTGTASQALSYSVIVPTASKFAQSAPVVAIANCGARLFGEKFRTVPVSFDASIYSKETAPTSHAVSQCLNAGLCSAAATLPPFGGEQRETAGSMPTEFLLFLAPNIRVTPNFLAPLLAAWSPAQKATGAPARNIGAVSPLILDEDGARVCEAGLAFSPSLRPVPLFAHFPATHPVVTAAHAAHPLQALSRKCLLLPRALFTQCKGFFSQYQCGGDVLELCAKLREADYTLHCIVESRVHFVDSTPVEAAPQEPNSTNAPNVPEAPENTGTASTSAPAPVPASAPVFSEDADLLALRCKGHFGPDHHKFAREHGFCLSITPWLESYLALAPQAEAALTAAHNVEQFDVSAAWDALQQNPLWEAGYPLIALRLEAAGLLSEACGLNILHCALFPSLPAFRQLAAAALAQDNLDIAMQAVQKIDACNALLEDPSPLIKKAAGLANWARKAGEAELQAIYEGWLKDLGLL